MKLISGALVEPNRELGLIKYIDELGVTIRPVLEILAELDEDSSISGGVLRNLLFGTLGHWDQINKFFCDHNRKVKGLQEPIENFNEIKG